MDEYQQALHILQHGEVKGNGRSLHGTPLLCFSFAMKSHGGEVGGPYGDLTGEKENSLKTFYRSILDADRDQLKKFIQKCYDFELGVLCKFRGIVFQYVLETLAELLPRRPDLAPQFFTDLVPFYISDALSCEQSINGLTKCFVAIFELQGAAEVVQTEGAVGALFEITSGMSSAGSGGVLREPIAAEARNLMTKIVEHQNNALGKFLISLKDGNSLRSIGKNPELCSRAVYPNGQMDQKVFSYFSQADDLQYMALPNRQR